VYVLGASTSRGPVTYVGWTVDLEQRLQAHNGKGGAKFTKGRRWQLLYAEALPDRREAMSREWHLKRDRQLRNALRRILLAP
jgi:putative endonuclease